MNGEWVTNGQRDDNNVKAPSCPVPTLSSRPSPRPSFPMSPSIFFRAWGMFIGVSVTVVVFTLAFACLLVGQQMDIRAMTIAGGVTLGVIGAVYFAIVIVIFCRRGCQAAMREQRELAAEAAIAAANP